MNPNLRTMPPMQVFHDVLAGPSANRRTPGVQWPDFEQQQHARLWRDGKAICTPPVIDLARARIIPEPGVFVSMHDGHFGHICAETVSRLPQSLAEAPGLPLYFSCQRAMTLSQASPVFRAILDWLKVPGDRVRFIHEPVLFRELRIAAQAEPMNGPPPPDGYLDLLESRIAGNLAPVRPEGVVFVTRAQLSPEQGRSAGERYLVFCLQQLGVRVMYPETLSVPEQMRIYAGARHLVFQEGSAIHGRQLLGRIDQHVSILRRRFRSSIAQHQIEPRCTSLTYVGCFGGGLILKDPAGWNVSHSMSNLYRVEPVLDHFESIGVPLRRVWDRKRFEIQRDEDILSWLRAIFHPNSGHWLRDHNSNADVLAQFDPLGLGHLLPEAAGLLNALRPQ
jgi:hypothetical protein